MGKSKSPAKNLLRKSLNLKKRAKNRKEKSLSKKSKKKERQISLETKGVEFSHWVGKRVHRYEGTKKSNHWKKQQSPKTKSRK